MRLFTCFQKQCTEFIKINKKDYDQFVEQAKQQGESPKEKNDARLSIKKT